MKLSARNILPGKVVAVTKGSTTAHVKVELASGLTVTSSITNEAVDELALKVGDSVSAVIKSSDVMIGKSGWKHHDFPRPMRATKASILRRGVHEFPYRRTGRKHLRPDASDSRLISAYDGTESGASWPDATCAASAPGHPR